MKLTTLLSARRLLPLALWLATPDARTQPPCSRWLSGPLRDVVPTGADGVVNASIT